MNIDEKQIGKWCQMPINRRLAILALVFGLVAGYAAKALTGSESRFSLSTVTSGDTARTFKINTRTGQVWCIVNNVEYPVTPEKDLSKP